MVHENESGAVDCVKIVSLVVLALFCAVILALLVADAAYLVSKDVTFVEAWRIINSYGVWSALKLSLQTSLITLILVSLTALPIGYALSRVKFPGHSLVNTIVDVPLVLPPVVVGLSLLAFFGSPLGSFIKEAAENVGISLISSVGIVMCQFLISIPYSIRSAKASFDSVDRKMEQVALSLGCTPFQAFRRITLPLARNGLVAGAVMTWARAIGVFGPLMVFIGTGPRVQVMPTKMWLELSIGNIEASLVIALISVFMAGTALILVHKLVPGRNWS